MNLTVRNTFALISITALISLLFGLTALDSLAVGQEPKRVFVLNSFNREYIWTANMLHGIDDAFGSSGISVETYVTFMDMKRIPRTPQYSSKIKEMIKEGYKGVRFDAVLACDNDALVFISQYRDELFPGVPVVFSSINDFDERMLGGRRDITGTSENSDYTSTVKIALKLLPATKNIIVVVDNTTTGKAHRSAVEKIRSDFPQDIVFTYLSLGDMTLSELAQKLSKLSSDSIVLLLHHFADRNGTTYTVPKSTPLLTQSSSVPVFVLADIRMGMGALGGHVVSGYYHGEAAAQMVVKILSGTDVRSIPVLLDSPNKYMFDYSVMQRFGIAENNIPQGSILINKPVQFYVAHRKVILTALGIIGFLSIIIALLIINTIQRRRSSEAIRRSEERFKVITSSTPDHLMVQDKDLRYSFVMNPQLGLTEQDMIGKTDYDFLSKEDADKLTEIKRQVLNTGSPTHVEVPLKSSKGEQQFFDGSYIPKFDAKGQIDGLIGYFRNVSERKRAEEEVWQLNKSYDRLTDNADEAIFRVEAEGGHVIYCNPAAERILGYSLAEWRADPALGFKLIHPDYKEKQKQIIEQINNNKHPVKNIELGWISKDGKTVLVEYSIIPICNAKGEIIFFESIGKDITERKQAEDALRAAETRYRMLFEHSPDGIVIIDPAAAQFLEFNETAHQQLGYSREEFAHLSISDLDVSETSDETRTHIQKVIHEGRGDFDTLHRTKQGEIRNIHVIAQYTEIMGRPVYHCIWRDITERKRAEEEIQASREQMRALAGHLQAVREEERTLIAREIHDELGGALTGMKIDFSLLTRAALKIENETVRASLLAGMDSVTKFIDATIHTVRRIAMELRPGVLDDLGLVAALEWQLKDFEKRTGIRCEYFPPVEDISLEADLSTALFRIFQEALTNVARHSGGTEVRVRLNTDADSSTLEVEDNGKGIEKEKTLSSKSLGLLGMRERAQMFGGRVTVTGTPGKGTIVTVEIPPVEKR